MSLHFLDGSIRSPSHLADARKQRRIAGLAKRRDRVASPSKMNMFAAPSATRSDISKTGNPNRAGVLIGPSQDLLFSGIIAATEPSLLASSFNRLKSDLRYCFLLIATRMSSSRRVFWLNKKERGTYIALKRSNIFNETWYLHQNPDVGRSGIDPLHHLVRHGIHEGRLPNVEAQSKGTGESSFLDFQNADYLAIVADLYASAGAMGNNASRDSGPIDKGHLQKFCDATVQMGIRRFEKFSIFKPMDYLALNEPLRNAPGIIAHRHAFTYGFSEGRAVFSRHTIANELGLRIRESNARRGASSSSSPPRVGPLMISIVYNASGNLFLEDFAQSLLFDLESDGHDVILLRDTDDPKKARANNIIVAPHEFFFLGLGANWIRDDVVRNSVMFNTEQPQTVWFDRAVPFNLMARAVIDISPQVASIYAESMPALHADLCGPNEDSVLPDRSDPIFRILPKQAKQIGSRDSPFETRSIDVSFFGGISPHRDRFFTKTARFFSDYRTVFYCRRDDRPLLAQGSTDLVRTARHVAHHSKIVLNIHREEFGFFEWHRIVRQGIETGAVVVSEPCLPHPDLKPNVHYFEESGRHIQNVVEWLLKTEDGRAEHRRVKANGLELIRQKRASKSAGNRIAHFLHSLDGDIV